MANWLPEFSKWGVYLHNFSWGEKFIYFEQTQIILYTIKIFREINVVIFLLDLTEVSQNLIFCETFVKSTL